MGRHLSCKRLLVGVEVSHERGVGDIAHAGAAGEGCTQEDGLKQPLTESISSKLSDLHAGMVAATVPVVGSLHDPVGGDGEGKELVTSAHASCRTICGCPCFLESRHWAAGSRISAGRCADLLFERIYGKLP